MALDGTVRHSDGYTIGYTTEDAMRGKGEGAIFKDGRGLWTAIIELPPVDGVRRRKVVRSKDKATVVRKLTAMRGQLRDHGDLPTAGQSLESWLTVWFETIVREVRPKTAATWDGLIRNHIVKSIGTVPLDKLTATHVRRMTTAITDKGLSSTTALLAHRVLALALKAAMREGRVTRNVTTLTDAPRKAVANLQALTVAEGVRVLRVAAGLVPFQPDPLGSLWAAVLFTGARQGELLGLELDRLDEVLDLSWQLQRIPWRHGCDPRCSRIRGTDCPDRKLTLPADFEHRHITGGLWWTRPKSKAGWRIIPLVEPLRSIIERQAELARSRPNPHGLLWTSPVGAPIDPRVEAEAWDELLKRAGVPDVRLHDGRHTTVDLLLLAGVPMDIIMEIVGHSSRAVTEGYKSRGNLPRLTEAMEQLSALLEIGH